MISRVQLVGYEDVNLLTANVWKLSKEWKLKPGQGVLLLGLSYGNTAPWRARILTVDSRVPVLMQLPMPANDLQLRLIGDIVEALVSYFDEEEEVAVG